MAAHRPTFQHRVTARRAARYDHGSNRRLRRITMRGNSSLGFWIFVVGILFILFAALPWFAAHPPRHHQAE